MADSSVAETTVVRVVPKPTRITNGDTVLRLSKDFQINAEGSLQGSLPGDLERAVQHTLDRLHANRHRYLSVQRGKELLKPSGSAAEISSLVLSLSSNGKPTSIAEVAVRPVEERPKLERYKLLLPLDGPGRLEADTCLGLFRGLSTFEQLFYYASEGFQYTPYAPYDIKDQPAFGWRAVLLDTSRNWFGIPAIQKMLDNMALVKVGQAARYH